MNNNWQKITINKICNICRGGSPRPINDYITDEKDALNWLRIGDIDNNAKYIKKTKEKIKKEALNYTTIVEVGEFILSNSMSFGRPYIMEIQACIHDGWLALKNINENLINKDFLYYYLLSTNIQKEFYILAAGSGVKNLNKDLVSNIKINIPPLEEQEKIVSILSKQDEVIEKLEKLIELKVRQKKGLMQRLLSGKLRLKGFSGEWKENIMQSIILIFKKTKHNSSDGKNNGKYPFFINNSESFLKFLDEFDYDAECIIANTGGNAFFDYYNGKFSASSDCFIFSSKINTLFLYYFLKSIEKTVNIVGFAGSGIKHLNKKWFYKLKILIPPTIEEQSAIASILSKCDEEIELLKKKLGLYRGQKKWLMEKLFSGEIRV